MTSWNWVLDSLYRFRRAKRNLSLCDWLAKIDVAPVSLCKVLAACHWEILHWKTRGMYAPSLLYLLIVPSLISEPVTFRAGDRPGHG